MRKLTVLAAALALMGVCSLASAQEFSEDFDSYVSGSEIHGQGGWKGWGNVQSAGATVSSDYAYSGENSVKILGTSDLVHEFTVDGGLWVLTAMQYVPSGTSGEPFFILMNRYDDAGTARDWSTQLHYRLGSGTITSEKEGDGKVAQIVFDRWIQIKCIIDLDNNTYDWYYNGELIETHAWDGDGHTTLQAIDLYGDSASPTYFDDVVLSIYDLSRASKPSPEDEQTDVLRSTQLSWTAGKGMTTHDVYLGTSFDDVNDASRDNPMDVLVSEGQAATTYEPTDLLDFGQTYYWRIDEVNDTITTKGQVWSFTVEAFSYAIESADITATASSVFSDGMGPEKTIDGSGLNADDQHSTEGSDMWASSVTDAAAWIQYAFDKAYSLDKILVWNSNQVIEVMLGFGVKSATIQTSPDGETWTVLGDYEFAQADGSDTYTANTTVDFNGVDARYVKLSINSSWGGPASGLSEVRFFHIPMQAREPEPADGETDVNVDTTLTWRAGREAASHTVYFSTDKQAVIDGTATAEVVTDAACTPDELLFGNIYYWKVTEINEAEATPAWEGDVWTFTTEEFGAIDDFESYDDAGNEVFNVWIDGYTDKSNGSQVGYIDSANGTFNETVTVNGGSQSMPFQYSNVASPYYSEAVRTWSTAQDWTANDADTFKLFFYGAAANSVEPFYIAVQDSSGKKLVITHSDPNAVLATSWQAWTIPLSTFTEAGVNVTKVTKMYIGVGNRTSPTAGGVGTIFIDDIRRGTSLARHVKAVVTMPGDVVRGVPNDSDWPAAETPALAFDDKATTKFLHFKGEIQATGVQVTPSVGSTVVTELTLTTANDAAERDPVTFELYGSNDGIDGPYTLIASGDIVDFVQATAWPRYTQNTTPITFDNSVAYKHYQVLFPTVRTPASANSMQIAEIELIGVLE